VSALRIGKEAPKGDDMKAIFAGASKVLQAQDEEGVKLLKRATSERLAFYTIEQEADDIAAEWVAETGLDPASTVEAMRRLGEGSEPRMRGFILGSEECEKLRAKSWRNDNGGYVFVPIGDYAEIHHSVCYRMFNLEREIKAHDLERAEQKAPVLDSSEWTALQKAAEDATGEEMGDLLGQILRKPKHPMLRKLDVMSCPYANNYF
jgi:hypothetical protein